MPLEGVRSAHVPEHGSRIAVTGLIHDPIKGSAALGRAGHVTGPKAMSPEGGWIESDRGRVPLDDVRDGLCGYLRQLVGVADRGEPPAEGRCGLSGLSLRRDEAHHRLRARG